MAIPLQRGQAVTSSHASQSQISAPVLEYRCMFTHDVHKKQKKWHDGTLRFHVFNKRVMVYDDARNFVGDLHYRLTKEFGEGLEFRLERPVLVQVEEQLGQSNTDLTPLLNRQKQDETTVSTILQPSRAAVSRTIVANPQTKPKSIRELLGASQGRIGRARISIQSPYEQRVALAEIQPTEPPAKRRKVQSDPESTTAPTVAAVPPKQSDRAVDNAVELSSDDDDNRPAVKKTMQCITTMDGQILDSASMNEGLVPDRTTKDSEPREKATKPKFKSKKSKSTTKTSRQSQVPVDSAAAAPHTSPGIGHGDTEKSVCPRARRPRSSLKFSSQTTRPKLMYRALLAGKSSAETTTRVTSRAHMEQSFANTTSIEDSAQIDHAQAGGSSVKDSFPASLLVDTVDGGSGIHSLSPSSDVGGQVENSLQTESGAHMDNGLYEATRLSSPVYDSVEITTITDSPLFMPRTDPQTSPLPAMQFMLDDLIIPDGSQINKQLEVQPHKQDEELEVSQSEHSQQDNAVGGANSTPQDLFHTADVEDSVVEESLKEYRPQSTTRNPQSATTRQSPVTKPVTPRIPVSTSRPFRRIVSENLPSTDVNTNAMFDDFDDIDDDNDDNDLNGQASPFPNQTKTKIFENNGTRKYDQSASLRQTASDSAVLEAMVTGQDSGESANSSRGATPQQNRVDVPDARARLEMNQESNTSAEEQENSVSKDTGTGAWTSTEAFLLFDWWPPGREKPDYGQQPSLNADVVRAGGRAGVDIVRPRLVHNINVGSAMAMASKKYGTFGSAKFVSQRS